MQIEIELMNKRDRILTDVYIILFLGLTIIAKKNIIPVQIADMSLWLVPALFGAYFLYRFLHYYFVEKRVVYRSLLIFLVSIVLIIVYG